MTPEQRKACERLALESWRHLKRTNKRSVNKATGQCVYNGCGCAFSVAIKPEYIRIASVRNEAADFLLEDYPEWLHDWAQDLDESFALGVQVTHDRCRKHSGAEHENFADEFYKALMDTCTEWGIKIPDYEQPS